MDEFSSASATDAAAVNPNGIKTLLANDLSTFFVYGKLVFNNGPKVYQKFCLIVLR